MKITLIGFGEVGSLVGALINTRFENIQLNVMNTQSTKSGRILDLEHAAAIRNNKIHHNSQEEHSKADFIIYSAGYSNVHGESRNTVSKKNKDLVFSLFEKVQYRNNPVIIVITNPVEPISYWIDQVVGQQARVIGTGTSLDTFRLKYLLAKKFNCQAKEIDCFVIGEHGQHMVPLYSQTRVKGQKITEICKSEELNAITDELINSAFQIRETEAATKYGIAETTLFLLNAFQSENSTTISVSGSKLGEWGNKFSIPATLFLSLPYAINSTEIHPVFFELPTNEKIDLQKAIDSITEQIK
jgi:malate/lactate dehydrogenase